MARSNGQAKGPAVAVAVVSWNTRDLLAACLDSLADDAAAGFAEVWVVDNGSTDGSRELVRERYPWVTLLTPEDNLGFGPAVNLVAARTTAPWLVAANADVRLEPGALRRLRDTAAADDAIGMVGPRLLLLDGSTQPSVQPFPGLATALLLLAHAGRFSVRARRALRLEGYREPAPGEAVPWITGALVLMRRSAFEQVGGFDPEQWLYAEDLDLCWRLGRAGWKIVYEPRSVVHHAHSAASGQRFEDDALLVHMLTTNYLWMLRRRGPLHTRLTALIGIVDAALLIAAAGLARDPAQRQQRRAFQRAALRGHLRGLAPRRRLQALIDPRRRG